MDCDLRPDLVALQMSREQLRSQKEDLRHIRGQASFSAALNGAIATIFLTVFFTSQDVSGQVFSNVLFFLAICSFLGSLVFSILAISDWKTCHFDQSARWIFSELAKQKADKDVIKTLALEAEGYFDENEKVVQGVRIQIWWSSVLAWAQAIAWISLLLIVEWPTNV